MHLNLVWIFCALLCVTDDTVCDVSLHLDNKDPSLFRCVKSQSGGKSCCLRPWTVLMAHWGSPEGPRIWGLPQSESQFGPELLFTIRFKNIGEFENIVQSSNKLSQSQHAKSIMV